MRRIIRLVDEYDFDDPDDKKLLLERIDSAVPSMGNDAAHSKGQTKLESDPISPSEGFEAASEKQIKYLRGLGYKGSVEDLSKKDASDKIKELQEEASG